MCWRMKNLGGRALELGEQFREKLREALAPFELVKEVRGMGLLAGSSSRRQRRWCCERCTRRSPQVHPAMFGQIIVMRMFREKNILTQICGNNFMVLKAAPPLVVSETQLDEFVSAIRAMVEVADSSPLVLDRGVGPGRRAVNI